MRVASFGVAIECEWVSAIEEGEWVGVYDLQVECRWSVSGCLRLRKASEWVSAICVCASVRLRWVSAICTLQKVVHFEPFLCDHQWCILGERG